jgi:hypothetical protein
VHFVAECLSEAKPEFGSPWKRKDCCQSSSRSHGEGGSWFGTTRRRIFFLLKYLSEEELKKPIAGLFLLAAPSWDEDQWNYRRSQATKPTSPKSFPNSAHLFLPQP